ncbi:MAG: hypothetical protein ABIR71_11575 [Chthoniobacterales bacterium]
MNRLRRCRQFLLLVALLFAVGHSHQMFGRFLLHHHDVAAAAAHHSHQDTDADHRPDRHDQEDAEHTAEHAAFAAIMPALFLPARTESHLLARIEVASVRVSEPRAAGIDHPPQLVG